MKSRRLALPSLLAASILGCAPVSLKTKIVETLSPPPPSGLTATPLVEGSSSSVDLAWTNGGDGSPLVVERSRASGDGGFEEVASPLASATGYKDTGLAAGTTYWYRVGAYNDVGTSYSNVASATTFASMTDGEAVAGDREALEIGFAAGDSASSVTANLVLPTVGDRGSAIAWASSSSSVIDVSTTPGAGAVSRPSTDTAVTLTATISRGSAAPATKAFDLTVKGSDAAAVAADKASLAIGFHAGDSASGVTQDLTLPLAGSSGSAVSWSTSDANVVSSGGAVTRGVSDAMATLTATISKGTASDTKQFALVVLASGASARLYFLDGGAWAEFPSPPSSTLSIAQVGATLYAIDGFGSLYAYDGGWGSLPLAALSGARSIAACSGALYALSADLSIHCLDGGAWQAVAYAAPAGAVAIAGSAQALFVLTGSAVDYLDGGSWVSMGAPANPISIAVLDGVLSCLSSSGDIFFYDGGWGAALPTKSPGGATELGGGSSVLYALSFQ